MATFRDYWNELLSWVPQLDPILSKKLVNRAWRDIQDKRPWSFNLVEGTITTPALISTGTVTVTQGSTTVTLDVDANAALVGILLNDLILRQFRVGSGPVYNIADYTAPTLTLARAYGETSATLATYEIYQCYYAAPSTDFLRWVSFVDGVNGFPLSTDWTKEEIDRIDPKRGAKGLPYRVASYRVNPANQSGATFTGQLQFELWPHPTGLITYPVLYQRRGIDFSADTAILPTPVRDETLIERAKLLAYEWAMANSGAHASLAKTNWVALMQKTATSFGELLNTDIKQDEEAFQMYLCGNYIYDFRGNSHLAHLPQFGPWFSSGSGYPY